MVLYLHLTLTSSHLLSTSNTIQNSYLLSYTVIPSISPSPTIQFRMVSMRSEKLTCAPPSLRSFPKVAFETVPMSIWWCTLSSFQGRSSSTSSFHTSLLQVIDGVVSLALFKGCERNRRQNWRGKRKLKSWCFKRMERNRLQNGRAKRRLNTKLMLEGDGKETDDRMDEGRENWRKSCYFKGMGRKKTIEWTKEGGTEERAGTPWGWERNRR